MNIISWQTLRKHTSHPIDINRANVPSNQAAVCYYLARSSNIVQTRAVDATIELERVDDPNRGAGLRSHAGTTVVVLEPH